MSVSVAHFSITGEFITEHARNLWGERKFSKAIDILECVMGTTAEQREDVLFGRAKFIGTNNLGIAADDWMPPAHYCPSMKQALTEGENYQELENRREDEAWRYARANYRESCGHRQLRLGYAANIIKLVGKKKGDEIMTAVMREDADARREQAEWEERNVAKVTKRPLLDVANMAMRAMKQRMELLGFDSSAMATGEAVINRGKNIIPTLDEKMESVNGWLLPDGKYYGCGAMEHVGLAANLLPDDVQDSEKEAERRGWIKLVKSVTGFHCLGQSKPTKKQLTALFDYAQQHQRDYEELISILPE